MGSLQKAIARQKKAQAFKNEAIKGIEKQQKQSAKLVAGPLQKTSKKQDIEKTIKIAKKKAETEELRRLRVKSAEKAFAKAAKTGRLKDMKKAKAMLKKAQS